MPINQNNGVVTAGPARNFEQYLEAPRSFNPQEDDQIVADAQANAAVPTTVQTALDLKAPLASPSFTGTLTNGGLEVDTSIQALTTSAGAGVVNVTTAITKLTSTGADALSLANGVNGQVKEIVMVVDGGDATLTPTTKTGFTTAVFGDVGDYLRLRFFTTLGWMVISNNGCVVS